MMSDLRKLTSLSKSVRILSQFDDYTGAFLVGFETSLLHTVDDVVEGSSVGTMACDHGVILLLLVMRFTSHQKPAVCCASCCVQDS